MVGSLFLSKKSKGDLHFAIKSWLTRMFLQNSWRFEVFPLLNPVQCPITRTVAVSYSSPHPPICTVPLTPSLTMSVTSNWWGEPNYPIYPQEWLEKNILWEVSGAGEPLFGTNPVKATIPEPFLSQGGLLQADNVCFCSRNTPFILWCLFSLALYTAQWRSLWPLIA